MGSESVETEDVRAVRVFMSYRRADDRHFIGRLHDRLCDAFGEERVFRDIDSIPAGTNFRQVILRTLDDVDAVVAVIGPNWARPSGGESAASTDYMFLELIEALKQGKPVVPVLIEDTAIPSLDVLPSDLRPLREINAISVHADPAFRRDSERLIDGIKAVVAEDRARIARERQAAEELARRAQADRSEREQRAAQLRAEERAARARLAELEDVATRRQIELERERLQAIEEELRKAELVDEVPPAVVAPAPEVTEVVPKEGPSLAPLPAAAPAAPAPSPASTVQANIPVFELLIIAALVLGVVTLLLNRSVQSDEDTVNQFNDMGGGLLSDVMVTLFTLATAVPIFLGKHPVERRFVVAGVAVSTFLFALVQDSAWVRYGSAYNETFWAFLRIVEIACLVGAYLLLRRQAPAATSSPRRYRVPLVVITIGCGALLAAATLKAWNDADTLIEVGYVPDKTKWIVWLVLIAWLPSAIALVLAARGSYAAQVTLASIATLGVLSYLSEADQKSNDYTHNGLPWTVVAMAHLLLAAVAWSIVITRAKSARDGDDSRSGLTNSPEG